MQRKVVATREGAFAERALERSVACVFAVVTGQFIGPREPPRASRPAAAVRLLARVRAQVRLEVRALAVRLDAAGVRARVDCHRASPAPRPPGRGRCAGDAR